ncbi:MAG: 30S ribosome-binding factor RbfA [Candidatus Pacebacteria bacterium]|nr:30S ribosome-binding factor RbfA [Candidatus Paceibacterota bacterium]
MKTFRKERISSLIFQELSKMISREFDFAGALATITEIQISDNLDSAKVGVSVFPSEKTDEVIKQLKSREKELTVKLLKKINIKPFPQLFFVLDRGLESAAKVEKILLNE